MQDLALAEAIRWMMERGDGSDETMLSDSCFAVIFAVIYQGRLYNIDSNI